MNDLLNDYQLQSLLSTLRMLEEDLRDAEAWLAGKEENGMLYHRKLTLSDEKRDAARKKISVSLEHITDLVRKLDLQPLEDNPAGWIRGKLSVSWANLLDSRSRKLGRYGKVDPRLTGLLDPTIERLARLALELARLFDDPGEPERWPDFKKDHSSQ